MRQLMFSLMAAGCFIGLLASGAPAAPAGQPDAAEVERFIYLSQHTTSSCAGSFPQAISTMPSDSRITGSCCSRMNLDHYAEQIQGLKKYKDIKDIPPDPYDINAGLAARLLTHDEVTLTPDQQKAYDYAMAHSAEKGPCCCKCWHWKVYSGLAKDLIQNYRFDGKQVTEVWDLSDGCGGAEGHGSAHSHG